MRTETFEKKNDGPFLKRISCRSYLTLFLRFQGSLSNRSIKKSGATPCSGAGCPPYVRGIRILPARCRRKDQAELFNACDMLCLISFRFICESNLAQLLPMLAVFSPS